MSARIRADFLLKGAGRLVTVAGGPAGPLTGPNAGELAEVRGGALAANDGRIVAVGPEAEVEEAIDLSPGAHVLDAAGRCVLPGLVDPHTHIVFAGDRADEYALRQRGATYAEILAAGGGILDTVRRTRAASADDLFAQSLPRLQRMLALGTTTFEIKSGYGLETATELRMLAVADRLGKATPARVVPTLLGAHAVPPEYRERRQTYVDLICEEMIPRAAGAGLARFCDVFCEAGAFSLAEAERILATGLRHGLAPKLHADQLTAGGGAQLAARLGATSADHLDFADDEGLSALTKSGVVAVLLPGASLILRHREHASARRFIATGVPVALATDCNPGSSYVESMPIILSLGCALLGVTPAEAIVAATRNAAYAAGVGDAVGSLAVGKYADLIVIDAPSPLHLPYHFGTDLVRQVVVGGRVVVDKESTRA
ncbi:MAG: imidazolonepropionase [Chloroflexota bacterium]